MKVGDRVKFSRTMCDRLKEDVNGPLRMRRGTVVEITRYTRRFVVAKVNWDNTRVVGMIYTRNLEREDNVNK